MGYFKRSHWAWECSWEEWNYSYHHDSWSHRSTLFGDHDTAFDKYGELRKLPPGQVRNVRISRRAVGLPMEWIRSS